MAGLYVHVPFCAKRCIYCDFYSGTNMAYKDGYLSALIHEMEMRRDYLRGEQINTVYFGGGTPSRLNVCDFERVFDAVYRLFSLARKPEITIEVNPDDLSDEYVLSLTKMPFNRISVGVQSFSDEDLRLLNRRHTAAEAVNAIHRCKDAGYDNISIDLMYGLPGQTVDGWADNIGKAVALDIPHISAYNLTYEEGTLIDGKRKRGEIQPAEDELCESFFYLLTDRLADADFIHYEISNFAKRSPSYPDGRISVHNSSYWNGTHYMGIGPSAHSCDGDTRSWNVSSVTEYVDAINEKAEIPHEMEYLDERTKYNDFVITRLRTIRGISLDELRTAFGEERERHFLKKSEPFISSKKLKVEGENVKVTRDGFFISDSIMRELIVL
ncbi:MAG: radical SAM family heme chaperone HemW [Tannerella sp.]|jgi:oxygen-independent coproporphyrinogen-3 oxidase|nr:radical SAM family heme chaperone HemW [Tannerella sp.]